MYPRISRQNLTSCVLPFPAARAYACALQHPPSPSNLYPSLPLRASIVQNDEKVYNRIYVGPCKDSRTGRSHGLELYTNNDS